jgi:hypothetical protein
LYPGMTSSFLTCFRSASSLTRSTKKVSSPRHCTFTCQARSSFGNNRSGIGFGQTVQSPLTGIGSTGTRLDSGVVFSHRAKADSQSRMAGNVSRKYQSSCVLSNTSEAAAQSPSRPAHTIHTQNQRSQRMFTDLISSKNAQKFKSPCQKARNPNSETNSNIQIQNHPLWGSGYVW